MQMPIHLGVVVEVNVNAILVRAVKVPRKRSKCALKVRRTAGCVVPCVANLAIYEVSISGLAGRVKTERISVAIGLPVKRHTGIDSVVECPLDDVGEFGVP